MTLNAEAVEHEKNNPELIEHLGNAHPLMSKHGLEKELSTLIELRASQINQCAYCVNMHTSDARKVGVPQDKLDNIIVWRNVSTFTDAEKAALAWTEALTVIDPKTNYGALRSDLRRHYSDKDITLITAAVGMINLWNRVQISKH